MLIYLGILFVPRFIVLKVSCPGFVQAFIMALDNDLSVVND